MFGVIFLPNFHLQTVLRFREELRGKPVGLLSCGTRIADGGMSRNGGTDSGKKAGLLEINEAAARAGVAPGQTSPQALARCPALTILSRSLVQEQAAQAVLWEMAGSLSPEIEATAEGICTVDLQASRDRDWATIGRRVVEALEKLNLRAQFGAGPNPDLAFLAARHARPVLVVQTPAAFLANLAIHELDPPPELFSVLRDWGIHNLAQLTSLPRGNLMDRLGPQASRLWERAAGQFTRPLRLMRPVEEFVEAFEFEYEVETAEPALFLLRRFLDQLILRLTNAYRVAGRMTLTMLLTNGSAHERDFTVPSPTGDGDVLFRILQTHFDGLQLDHGLVGVRLRIEPALAERQQFQLFESPLRDPNRFGETLGRLAALVGTENVGVAEVLDTHRPDSFRLVAPRFEEVGEGTSREDLTVGLPLRRYRPALPAQVRIVRHRPVFVVSEKAHGAIRESLGPYRASGDWWETNRWTTEEWDVEMEDGSLYRLMRNDTGWCVEGSYDEKFSGFRIQFSERAPPPPTASASLLQTHPLNPEP
ncbi:MAG TPA: DNA polymerase Y family protein [Chthoniobacterales bacterium]